MITTKNPELLAVVLGCLLGASCGGASQQASPDGTATSSSPPTSSRPSTGLIGPEVVSGCAGFGAQHAADILGVPASAVADRTADIARGIRGCAFERTDGKPGAVYFSLERDESVEAAARAYADMRDALPIAAGAQENAGVGSEESSLIEISGLGDEALWTSVSNSLTVRVRNLTIQVTGPPDRKTQVAVAQKVLGLV